MANGIDTPVKVVKNNRNEIKISNGQHSLCID